MLRRKQIDIEAGGKDYKKSGYAFMLPIFNFNIDIVVSKPFANFDCDGCVVHETGKFDALVWLNEKKAKDTVIHESVHLAQVICRTITTDETDNRTKDELMAYLTEYIAKNIMRIL